MDEKSNRNNYIIIFLFTSISTVLFLIYLYQIIKYILSSYKTKKLSILWLQYLTTFILYIIFIIVYIIYIFSEPSENIIIFNEEQNPTYIILLTAILVANSFNIVNNLIYDSIVSCKISLSLYKMKNMNVLNYQSLLFKLKEIETNFFDKKKNIIIYIIFLFIDIGLIIGFEFEYTNYYDKYGKNTPVVFLVKTYIVYILKFGHSICFIALIVIFFILNIFKKKFLNKIYYHSELIGMKIYNMFYQKILFSSDIITIKIFVDLIINSPILIFLIFRVSYNWMWVFTEIIIYSYILIFGALIFKLDQINEIGELPQIIIKLFFFEYSRFSFYNYDYKYCLLDNTYKYSKQEKQILKNLKLIDNNIETEIIRENDDIIQLNDSFKISKSEEKIIKIDSLNIRQSREKIKNNKTLNFNTVSELYVLYKSLMLYFENNEKVYNKVQNKINEDGTPFKQFFPQQNITKNKKKKARQTFGGVDLISKKKDFITNIDRISRISKLNSSNINSFLKISESKMFFSLEEKEIREEFKNKYKDDKEIIFKIESLAANSFFELFPFYQISIQDIIKSLYPSDNKNIFDILLKQKNKTNKNTNNIESESEDNLFYTYNSSLMMEVYDPEEFISSQDLSKFVFSYGSYLIETIKNINFTFIPLILGIFNIEISKENKIVILYRNPLFFTNFNHFNHWINFFITEGPEKLKASIFQNEIIDINEIEIKNSLKMNEADYEEIINNLKRDFDFFMKINNQVFPIIHLFIGDEKDENNILVNESSIIENTSIHPANLSGLLNESDDNIINTNIFHSNADKDILYKTENNSLVDKEYYSLNGNDIHTIKIYFTHFFRQNCELNKQNDIDDAMKLKANHYCQYLEGQILTYLTKTTLFGIEDSDNII